MLKPEEGDQEQPPAETCQHLNVMEIVQRLGGVDRAEGVCLDCHASGFAVHADGSIDTMRPVEPWSAFAPEIFRREPPMGDEALLRRRVGGGGPA